MPDTIDGLVRAHADDDGDKPMVIDTDGRITYAELDATTRDLAAAFIAAGVGKGSRVGLIMPNCVQWVQIAVALTRIGAVLVPLSTLLQPPELVAQLRVASVQFLVAVRGVPRPPLPRRRGTANGRHCLRCARCGRQTGCRRARRAVVDKVGRNRHAQRHARDHVHVGQQRPAQGRHPLARQRAGRGAVRSRSPVYRPRHPALPADAVLLGGRIRQRCAVGAAGRRHPGHRADPPAGDDAAAAGEGACHAVSRLARPGRSAGTPNGFRRSRSVSTATRQPGGVATRRATGRARGAGEAVRDDRVVRPVLRLSRRHRHAAVGMGQLRKAVRGHGGSHRRPRQWRAAADGRGGNDPDPRALTSCAGYAGAAARISSPPTATTPPATSATSTTTASCSTTAAPTTCSRSAVPPSTPARSNRRCAPSTASTTLSSPRFPEPSAPS